MDFYRLEKEWERFKNECYTADLFSAFYTEYDFSGRKTFYEQSSLQSYPLNEIINEVFMEKE